MENNNNFPLRSPLVHDESNKGEASSHSNSESIGESNVVPMDVSFARRGHNSWPMLADYFETTVPEEQYDEKKNISSDDVEFFFPNRYKRSSDVVNTLHASLNNLGEKKTDAIKFFIKNPRGLRRSSRTDDRSDVTTETPSSYLTEEEAANYDSYDRIDNDMTAVESGEAEDILNHGKGDPFSKIRQRNRQRSMSSLQRDRMGGSFGRMSSSGNSGRLLIDYSSQRANEMGTSSARYSFTISSARGEESSETADDMSSYCSSSFYDSFVLEEYEDQIPNSTSPGVAPTCDDILLRGGKTECLSGKTITIDSITSIRCRAEECEGILNLMGKSDP